MQHQPVLLLARTGGGAAIYALASLNPQLCSRGCPRASNSAKWERIVASLQFCRSPVTIICSYFSPCNNADSWTDFISQISDFLAARDFSRSILCGDLNHCSSCPAEFALLKSFCDSFKLCQLVNEPTHVTSTSARIIDLAFIGAQLSVSAHGITTPVESTHSTVWFQLSGLKSAITRRSFKIWLWDDADWDRITFMLSYLPSGESRPWANEIWAYGSAEAAVSAFSQTLRDTLLQCIPQKTINVRGHSEPGWFSHAIKLIIRRRDKAYISFKANPTSKTHAKFKTLQRLVKKEVRIAKKQFVLDSFQDVASTGDFWKAFRRVSGSSAASLPPLQLPNGHYLTNDLSKAKALASEFHSNFNHLALPPLPLPSEQPLDAEHLCTLDFVIDWLLQLRQNSATGLDGIPARFLKGALADICRPLHCLINRCFLEGHFPADWKLAKIAPIPKVHDSMALCDFRPISILPVLSKLAEHWLLACILPWLQPSDRQFAFWHGRSTEDAVAYIQCCISRGFETCISEKMPAKVAVVSFDIKRAFDQVCHKTLLQILEERGVPVPLLRLVHSYLCERKMVVSANGAMSPTTDCLSGVPQGSILGGFLFNVYIDGVFGLDLSSGADSIGFADDLVLIKPLLSPACEAELQSDISIVVSFYKNLLLSIQPLKCSALLCSISPRPASFTNLLLVDGTPIPFVSCLKYLGVLFDRKLNFSLNAEAAALSGRKILGSLRRLLFPLLGKRAFNNLYLAKIVPILTYCISVAAPNIKSAFLSLEKVHRLAARFITNDWSSSCCSLLSRLKWKPISRLCFERRSLLCFKYVHSIRHHPPSLVKFVEPSTRQMQLRSCPHKFDLAIPHSKRAAVDQIPIWNCFHSWNALPQQIKSCASFPTFKAAIRNFANFSSTQAKIPDRLLLFDNL